jgi:hypothetical protein
MATIHKKYGFTVCLVGDTLVKKASLDAEEVLLA